MRKWGFEIYNDFEDSIEEMDFRDVWERELIGLEIWLVEVDRRMGRDGIKNNF